MRKEYYVPAGFESTVKEGDVVEAGDVLSEGLANPAEIVHHKGIGEGRKYFADTMKRAFDEGGLGGISRRNFEIISKSLIDHVRITHPEGIGDHLPGSIVSYHTVERDYQPRQGSSKTRIDLARGKHLEEPILHYTIGTRLTNKMIDHLKKHGVEHVTVHEKEPDFHPEMLSMKAIPAYEPDWMHQLYSTELERKLIQAVNTGAQSSLKGPSPVAGLAYGVGFGQRPRVKLKKAELLEGLPKDASEAELHQIVQERLSKLSEEELETLSEEYDIEENPEDKLSFE